MKAFIFDLDGVLLDSEYMFHFTLKKLFKQRFDLDVVIDEEVTKLIAGRTDKVIVKNLVDYFKPPVSYEEFREILETYKDEDFGGELEPMEGAVAFLEHLKKDGFKLAIASSGPYRQVVTKLHQLNCFSFFDEIVSGEKVERSKPAPDIFLLAAERLNETPDNCVVIEDSTSGVAAGKAAGMFTIGFKGSKCFQDTGAADLEVYAFKDIDLERYK